MNAERLLNVVRALRESLAPELFDMELYVHECGSPACALGHYAMRPDFQDDFTIQGGNIRYQGAFCFWNAHDAAARHFDITKDEAKELFDDDGCGGARTIDEAADYIVAFVEIKRSARPEDAELAVAASS